MGYFFFFDRLFLFKISFYLNVKFTGFRFKRRYSYNIVFMFAFYFYFHGWTFICVFDEETCLLSIHLILQLFTELAGLYKTTCDMAYLALTEHLRSLRKKNCQDMYRILIIRPNIYDFWPISPSPTLHKGIYELANI